MHKMRHLQITYVIYPQVHLRMVMVSCAHSVSVCRERAIVSTATNKDQLWHCQCRDHMFEITPLLLFSLCRVCKCSGAADRCEVPH